MGGETDDGEIDANDDADDAEDRGEDEGEAEEDQRGQEDPRGRLLARQIRYSEHQQNHDRQETQRRVQQPEFCMQLDSHSKRETEKRRYYTNKT